MPYGFILDLGVVYRAYIGFYHNLSAGTAFFIAALGMLSFVAQVHHFRGFYISTDGLKTADT